jgi:hypothetical protein
MLSLRVHAQAFPAPTQPFPVSRTTTKIGKKELCICVEFLPRDALPPSPTGRKCVYSPLLLDRAARPRSGEAPLAFAAPPVDLLRRVLRLARRGFLVHLGIPHALDACAPWLPCDLSC